MSSNKLAIRPGVKPRKLAGVELIAKLLNDRGNPQAPKAIDEIERARSGSRRPASSNRNPSSAPRKRKQRSGRLSTINTETKPKSTTLG